MTLIEPRAGAEPLLARTDTYRSRLADIPRRFPVGLPAGVADILAAWASRHWLSPGDETVETILADLNCDWAARARAGLDEAAGALTARVGVPADHPLGRLGRWAAAAVFVTPATAWAGPLLTAPLTDAETLAVSLYVTPELADAVAVLADDWPGTVAELLGAARAINRSR